MNPQSILTIEQKADLVGNDLIAAAEAQASNLYYNNSPYLSPYIPSRKLLEIMDEHEIVAALSFLKGKYCVSFEVLRNNRGGSDAYAVTVNLDTLRAVMRGHETARLRAATPLKPLPDVPQGVKFDKVRSTLTVNGIEVLLGKSHGDKSFQYWIVYHTITKPNKAITELKILDSYSKDFGEIARKRAIRDAVYDLNDKLKFKAKQENKLFLYSKGNVTYVDDNVSPLNGFSVIL